MGLVLPPYLDQPPAIIRRAPKIQKPKSGLFLPPMVGVGLGGGGSSATPAVFQNTSTTVGDSDGTVVVDYPTGTVPGDLLIAFVTTYDIAMVMNPVSGWTVIRGPDSQPTGNITNCWLAYHISTDTGGVATFTFSDGRYSDIAIARITGAHPTAPIQTHSTATHGVSASRLGTTLTIDQDGTLVIVWSVGYNGVPTTPAGLTQKLLLDGVCAIYAASGVQNAGSYTVPAIAQSVSDSYVNQFIGIVPAP